MSGGNAGILNFYNSGVTFVKSKLTNMSAIDAIINKLSQYPQLEFKVQDNKISVNPLSFQGFVVWLSEADNKFTVGFDGWHQEFVSKDEALNCFAFGLSDECRLKVEKRGKLACSWTVEYMKGDEWIEDSKTGLIFVPFWKKKTIQYLTNPIVI